MLETQKNARTLIVSPDLNTIISPALQNQGRLTFSNSINTSEAFITLNDITAFHEARQLTHNIPPAKIRRNLGKVGMFDSYLMQLYVDRGEHKRDFVTVHHRLDEIVANIDQYDAHDAEIIDRFVHMPQRDLGQIDQLVLRQL